MKIVRWLGTRIGALAVLLAVALLAPHALAALPVVFGTTTTAFQPGGASDINEALKILFNDPIVYNVVSDSEMLSLFEEDNNVKTDETTGGRYIETAQYLQLPAGVGARGENDYIPIPDGPVVKNSRVYLKKLVGAVEMSGDTMRRVKDNPGAFLDWAARALPDLVTRLNNEIDRMTIGYGAAVKARVQALPGAAKVRVDRAFGVAINGANLTDTFLQFLQGERIVFGPTADGANLRDAGANQAYQVLDVDETNEPTYTELTLDRALSINVLVNDYVFPGDASGTSTQDASGADREIMGLLGMVDEGTVLATFQNLLRASYRLWNSIAIDSSVAPYNGSLTEDLLTVGDDQVSVLGGGKINVIVTSRSGARSYWKSLRSDRRINDPRAYTGGKGPLGVLLSDRELMLKVVRKMPPEIAFGLDTTTFKRWTLGGWTWDDQTGSLWNRVTDANGRKDAFYAVGYLYKQLGCLAPRKNVRFGKLTRA